MIVVITGGLLGVFENSIPKVNYIEPDLTLEGLRMIYQNNQAL